METMFKRSLLWCLEGLNHPFPQWGTTLCGLVAVFAAFGVVSGAAAQDDGEESVSADAESAEEEPSVEDDPATEEEGTGESPRLRPPADFEPPEVGPAGADETVEETTAGEDDDGADLPDPDAAQDQLLGGAPPSSDPTDGGWTAPQTGLTVHGYLRVRGNLWDNFFLGRDRPNGGAAGELDLPFSRFRPWENNIIPAGGCGASPEPGTPTTPCGSETLGFANMRFRLEPTLALSDDVRIHTQIDILNNVVLGSNPNGLVLDPGNSFARTPGATGSIVGAQTAPDSLTTSIGDSLIVRRAWAEVTNRGLGQLRFGRMGAHWGLGMLWNGGDGIDSDFQTDVDRIMAVTKIAGLYLIGAYDFASEGFAAVPLENSLRIPYDVAQDDEVDQFVFAVAKRMDEEEQRATLENGGWVLNAGLQFMYRAQKLSSNGLNNPFLLEPPARTGESSAFVRREAESFVPDLWVQFLFGKLRLELEAAFIGGSVENTENNSFVLQNLDVLQFGLAFEAEYRLLDDKLGFYFNTGYASGDSNVEGLSLDGDPVTQRPAGSEGSGSLTTFRFHPNYRIDLILWRNIIGQVAGAYYFKGGVSYDFLRNSFGQLFGARADLIYSRASSPLQTWGNDPNLGVEANVTLYYRSEDGPDLIDGFYGMMQYGILFPMSGLGYLSGETGAPDLSNAQTLRLLLGVQY